MRIKPEEITSVLKSEIEHYRAELAVEEEGKIIEVRAHGGGSESDPAGARDFGAE